METKAKFVGFLSWTEEKRKSFVSIFFTVRSKIVSPDGTIWYLDEESEKVLLDSDGTPLNRPCMIVADEACYLFTPKGATPNYKFSSVQFFLDTK